MAQLLVVTVYDSKVGSYSALMCVNSRGEAIRTFSDAARDEKLQFHLHPGDYTLFVVGSFDSNSGVISSLPLERVLGADEVG